MQNPLLNDYIKKGNHGWAHAFQKLGFVIGEIIAFVILLIGVEGDKATQDFVFNCMSWGILIIGLVVSIFMVKDRKVKRNYQTDSEGVLRRDSKKLQFDDDEEDTSSAEEDLDGVNENSMLVKAKKMATCERSKLVLS